MKKLTLVIFPFIILSCNPQAQEKIADEKPETVHKKNFDYLVGEWRRTNDTKGRETFESWKKLNDSTYLGHGFTMEGNDTIWQERIVLAPVENVFHFQVKSPEDTIPTDFRVTKTTGSSFVCENQQNEFPKIIRYWKNGDNLSAEISDGQHTVPFEFSRIK